MEVGIGPDDFVLDVDPVPPSPKGARASQFSVHVYCGQTAGWIKMAVGMEVDQLLFPKRAHNPQFLAHFYCGQTAGCIKMSLGTEVRLGPGNIVLNGAHLSPKRAQPPIFGLCLLWPNGCMYQDTTWYGGWPQPRQHCVRWGPSSSFRKGAQPPNFRPISVVAKCLDRLRWHLVWR